MLALLTQPYLQLLLHCSATTNALGVGPSFMIDTSRPFNLRSGTRTQQKKHGPHITPPLCLALSTIQHDLSFVPGHWFAGGELWRESRCPECHWPTLRLCPLQNMTSVFSQGSASFTIAHTDAACKGPGYLEALTGALQGGMVLTMSVWGDAGSDMSWLDVSGLQCRDSSGYQV